MSAAAFHVACALTMAAISTSVVAEKGEHSDVEPRLFDIDLQAVYAQQEHEGQDDVAEQVQDAEQNKTRAVQEPTSSPSLNKAMTKTQVTTSAIQEPSDSATTSATLDPGPSRDLSESENGTFVQNNSSDKNAGAPSNHVKGSSNVVNGAHTRTSPTGRKKLLRGWMKEIYRSAKPAIDQARGHRLTKRLHIDGEILIGISIDPKGRIHSVHVLKSCGVPAVDDLVRNKVANVGMVPKPPVGLAWNALWRKHQIKLPARIH